MADIKWIKLSTDIFDNRKIRILENLPEGDTLIVIWIKLLCLAGTCNEYGTILLTKEIPYTEQMLATIFGRKLSTIKLALKTFQEYNMIEIVEDFIKISNWEKYQATDKMEIIKEQTRLRVAKYREKNKLLQEKKNGKCNVTCNVTSNVDVTDSNVLEVRSKKKEVRSKNISIYQENVTEDDKNKINELLQYYLPDATDRQTHLLYNLVNEYGIDNVIEAMNKTASRANITGYIPYVKKCLENMYNEDYSNELE